MSQNYLSLSATNILSGIRLSRYTVTILLTTKSWVKCPRLTCQADTWGHLRDLSRIIRRTTDPMRSVRAISSVFIGESRCQQCRNSYYSLAAPCFLLRISQGTPLESGCSSGYRSALVRCYITVQSSLHNTFVLPCYPCLALCKTATSWEFCFQDEYLLDARGLTSRISILRRGCPSPYLPLTNPAIHTATYLYFLPPPHGTCTIHTTLQYLYVAL